MKHIYIYIYILLGASYALNAAQFVNRLNKEVSLEVVFSSPAAVPEEERKRYAIVPYRQFVIPAHDVTRMEGPLSSNIQGANDNYTKVFKLGGYHRSFDSKVIFDDFPLYIFVRDAKQYTDMLAQGQIDRFKETTATGRAAKDWQLSSDPLTYFTIALVSGKVAIEGPFQFQKTFPAPQLTNKTGKEVIILGYTFAMPSGQSRSDQNLLYKKDAGNTFEGAKVKNEAGTFGKGFSLGANKTTYLKNGNSSDGHFDLPINLPLEITFTYQGKSEEDKQTYTIRLKDLIYHGADAYSKLEIIDKDGKPVIRREESKEQKAQQESKENKGEAEQTTTTQSMGTTSSASSSQQQQAQTTVTSASS